MNQRHALLPLAEPFAPLRRAVPVSLQTLLRHLQLPSESDFLLPRNTFADLFR
jgi:hypothetical protein